MISHGQMDCGIHYLKFDCWQIACTSQDYEIRNQFCSQDVIQSTETEFSVHSTKFFKQLIISIQTMVRTANTSEPSRRKLPNKSFGSLEFLFSFWYFYRSSQQEMRWFSPSASCSYLTRIIYSNWRSQALRLVLVYWEISNII